MHRFRRSGSFVRFFVEGEPADVSDLSLLKALERERFKPIDGSATDDESVGWVTRSDPSGARFEPEEMIADHFLVFALRVDKKKVPATLLKIEVSADLRGASRGGKPLPREQKKAIAEEAKRKLLARALPSVSLTDCVWNTRRGVLYVFATGNAVLERTARHFRDSFQRSLAPATPTLVAERLKLPDAMRKALGQASELDLLPRERDGAHRDRPARAGEVEA